MPNHYHAIFDAERARLSKALHRLNGVYATQFNERHNRVGHLFQDRFHARVARGDEHLAKACAYVWNNPVRAGLCAEAHEWPWSGGL
jgi:REP element-mobilizing transposase RayT